jgi:hypothetical protein
MSVTAHWVTNNTASEVRYAFAEPPARPPLWQHLEDAQIADNSWGKGIRPCAPCPAVFTLKDNPNAVFGEQWQYALRAWNYNMLLKDVYLLLDDHLAFANDSGFVSLDNPGGKADYFFRRNVGGKAPNLDKVRTCSRSILTGEAHGGYLKVTTFDSRSNPPLKPGRTYPKRVEDANIDDYLYNPREHPWMFFAATIVNRSGEVVQFPRGGLYPWFEGGTSPVSWMPHISNHGYGDVWYPLSRLRQIGEPLPSPYRRNG